MADQETFNLKELKQLKMEMTKFLMNYEFALEEITTKINILSQEFHYTHEHNPIEHVNYRLKSPESIVRKMHKKNLPLSLSAIQENITDIAGVRIVCSFISDIYALCRMLENQQDIKVIEIKDYIRQPKPSGYQSLHMLVKIPVYMSDCSKEVCVEIQIRTIAMDFWASLEHKIYYKYNQEVPGRLINELKEAADSAAALDRKMEKLHLEMKEIKLQTEDEEETLELLLASNRFRLPERFLTSEGMLNRKNND
jgi:putative GTP pyrophosphokinase